MVRQRLLDPQNNLSGAFRRDKAGYKIDAFSVLLKTKPSDTARCFLKDMDGSQLSWAQQILAIPSVLLLWTPCTDLVIIPSKGSPWDSRKWLQPHREGSSSLSEKHHSPCDTIHRSCRASQRLLQMKNKSCWLWPLPWPWYRGEEVALHCSQSTGGLRAVPLAHESLESPLCPAAPLTLRCSTIDWELNHTSWGWFQSKIFPITNPPFLKYFNWGRLGGG